jgi:hypothetical protein
MKQNKITTSGYWLVSDDEKFCTGPIDVNVPKDQVLQIYLFDYVDTLSFPKKPTGTNKRTITRMQEELNTIEDHASRNLLTVNVQSLPKGVTLEEASAIRKFKIVKTVKTFAISTVSKRTLQNMADTCKKTRINKIIEKLNASKLTDEDIRKFEDVSEKLQ